VQTILVLRMRQEIAQAAAKQEHLGRVELKLAESGG
jgi:hypothetical protein